MLANTGPCCICLGGSVTCIIASAATAERSEPVSASVGGVFDNYAIVQGADHIVPVDVYLPGCPPRPEMLIDAILKVHEKAKATKMGAHRQAQITELEELALQAEPTSAMKGLLR